MAENLFVGSVWVVGDSAQHAYLIHDTNSDADDDVKTLHGNSHILRGGPAFNHGYLDSSIIVERFSDVRLSVDWGYAQTSTNLNPLDATKWTTMWDFAATMGDANDPATGLFDTDIFYFNRNSNSVVSTLLNVVGIDFRQNLPLATVVSRRW